MSDPKAPPTTAIGNRSIAVPPGQVGETLARLVREPHARVLGVGHVETTSTAAQRRITVPAAPRS